MTLRKGVGSNQHQTRWQEGHANEDASTADLPAPPLLAAVTFEQVVWEPTRDETELSRWEADMVGQPYPAALPVRIANVAISIDADAAARSDDARAAIARLDAELAAMFVDVLDEGQEFAPLPSILLRTESTSSSQVEGIYASAEELALAELGHPTSTDAALEVAANVSAMHRALAGTQAIDGDAILQVHAALMAGRGYAAPGKFRDVQVWIQGDPGYPHGAEFVPPAPTRVPEYIDDLTAFANRGDIPLFTQAAVLHAQFETIHPFRDGNGRVGRALLHTMLRRGGATTRFSVPVSAGLVADIDGYIRDLTAYRGGDASPIVRRFADAAIKGVADSRRLAGDMSAIHRRWIEQSSARRGSAARRVLPHLLSQPVVDAKILSQTLKVSRQAADMAIATLAHDGVLSQVAGGDRNRVWVADDVTMALDEFAGRARRQRTLWPQAPAWDMD